ncbi:MAG TPA: S8 family serine peptidase, partial [Pilimelia sp.]|nr:S8 family serine peptidase [Pilimelia sp.]
MRRARRSAARLAVGALAGAAVLTGAPVLSPGAALAPAVAAPPATAPVGVESTAAAADSGDRVLVRLDASPRPGAAGAAGEAGEHTLAAAGAQDPTGLAGGWYAADVEGGADGAAARALLARPDVLAVEPDPRRRITAVANDPSFRSQPYLGTVRVPEAWDSSTASSGPLIAVLDTGVDLAHPDLAGKVDAARAWNTLTDTRDVTDLNGHGTAVAGVAAAATNNGIGIAGVAPGARILPVVVASPEGWAFDSDVIEGITYAADAGASVINLSLSSPQEASAAMLDAVAYATARGAVVVAAAGNSGTQSREYPAALDDVISVGATDDAGRLAYFSSSDDTVDVAAPGLWLTTTQPGGGYRAMSGTSFAAPVVAGVAALVRSAHPDWTPAQVRARLTVTARDAGPRGLDPWYGHGVVDAAAALGWAAGAPFPLARPDGDDTPAAARALPVPGSASGALAVEGDVDVLTWVAPAGAPPGLRLTVGPAAPAATGGQVLVPAVRVLDEQLRVLTESVPDPFAAAPTVSLDFVPVAGRRYHVEVRNGASSIGGGYVVTATGSAQRLGPAAAAATDALPRAWVAASTPAHGAWGVAAGSAVSVVAGRALAAGSVNRDTVRLLDARTGAPVPATVRYDAARRTVTASAATTGVARPYVLQLRGLRDTAGATMPGTHRLPFVVGGPAGDRFTALPPQRLLDTRHGVGAPRRKVGPAGVVDLVLAGTAGVPSSATAVVLNVTVVAPSGSTVVRAYPVPATGS